MDNLIVIKLGESLIVFDRDDVPFFFELEKTDKRVLTNGNELIVYEVPNEEIAKQIYKIMGNNLVKEDTNNNLDNNVSCKI